jgi:hypothetical protein
MQEKWIITMECKQACIIKNTASIICIIQISWVSENTSELIDRMVQAG